MFLYELKRRRQICESDNAIASATLATSRTLFMTLGQGFRTTNKRAQKRLKRSLNTRHIPFRQQNRRNVCYLALQNFHGRSTISNNIHYSIHLIIPVVTVDRDIFIALVHQYIVSYCIAAADC